MSTQIVPINQNKSSQFDHQFLVRLNTSRMLHPLIKWAQRKDRVFIEVQLRDVSEQKVDLTDQTVRFEGVSDSKKYEFSLELFAVIDKENSKWSKTGFHLLLVLMKKDPDQSFWPRLTKESAKNQYIQVDWDKWVDEDEEGEEGHKGLSQLDPSQMQGFPGMGDDVDEDDEDDEKPEENIEDLDRPEEVEEKASG